MILGQRIVVPHYFGKTQGKEYLEVWSYLTWYRSFRFDYTEGGNNV